MGENDGEIYDSHADVCVHAQSSVGGFMGSGSGIVKRCYSLGDVSGGGYVGGFAGSIRYVDTALSAGRVEADGSDGQGYAGGFAGYLSGTIVGAPAYVPVKAVYGYCGDTLSAAGRTDYTQTGESLQEAMAAMQLTTKEAVKERLKTLFDVDYEIRDEEQERREEAARKMQAQIEALPAADALTKENGELVDAAKAAFDALDDETKALVSESMKTKLTACVARMEELRKEPELPADPVVLGRGARGGRHRRRVPSDPSVQPVQRVRPHHLGHHPGAHRHCASGGGHGAVLPDAAPLRG